jgi:hypothetical protein
MSSRDEGIFGKQNVLLYVAEAVLKHTMSHDHSHFSSLFPLVSFAQLNSDHFRRWIFFLFGRIQCGGDTFFFLEFVGSVLIWLVKHAQMSSGSAKGRTSMIRSSAHAQ